MAPPSLKRLADLLGKAVTVTAFAAMLPGPCRYRREPEAPNAGNNGIRSPFH
jgi:hypothetical protein